MAKLSFSIKCKGKLELDNGIKVIETPKDKPIVVVDLLEELKRLAGEEVSISITRDESIGTPDADVQE